MSKRRVEEIRNYLVHKILNLLEDRELVKTQVPGLFLSRSDNATAPTSYILPASLCLVLQGAKRVFLGKEVYVYDANHFLITSVDLPVTAQVIDASKEKPYIGLRLEIDVSVLSELIVDLGLDGEDMRTYKGIAVGEVDGKLLDAFRRMVELLEEPHHIPTLAPMVHREILYRLLMCEQRNRLLQIAVAGTRGYQLMRAVEHLKRNFAKDLDVRELANSVGMSVASFYRHFQRMMGMTPLQYLKKLRLCEARKLILEGFDVTSVAYQVGYESLSHFSKDYKSFFGVLPSQDLRRFQVEGRARRTDSYSVQD